MMDYHWGMGGFWMILIWIAVIAIIIFAVWGLMKNSRNGRREEPSAMELLKRKYASGEISEEEFERKKEKLMQS